MSLFTKYNLHKKDSKGKVLALALPHLIKNDLKLKKILSPSLDMFLEMIKTMSISAAEMNRRFVITNIDLVKEFEDKGKVPFYWPLIMQVGNGC
jgi:KDO2-lipid IV(A) lauroyltransferase